MSGAESLQYCCMRVLSMRCCYPVAVTYSGGGGFVEEMQWAGAQLRMLLGGDISPSASVSAMLKHPGGQFKQIDLRLQYLLLLLLKQLGMFASLLASRYANICCFIWFVSCDEAYGAVIV